MDAELEQRIVKRASELFLMHGIKSITMDFIAGDIGISKRTLYEVFRDKDALLLKTLAYQEEKSREERDKLALTCTNPFELGLKEFARISQAIRRVNRNYMRDLQKYHPKVLPYLEANRKSNTEGVIRLTEEGIREGYVRPELNGRLLALILQAQFEILMNFEKIEEYNFSFSEVFETIVINFARGMATQKGLELVDNYLSKKNE